ncbi:carbon-nitrogen family hydrolase [Streptomyces sp. TS71-3]|uniref:carbon-nitrogen family hydrolase n=1 Tax=Streptomyces sp. TS71-3 TaxID=2733862 RepID=UPI001AFDAAD2|nr:carbon-nitrogen family hydrolase [Streptomyces sp. TS71-3]GHJ40337.1 hydrolase [Streptomyces sp. TS71-3]
MRASLIQIAVSDDEPVATRRRRAASLVADAARDSGADLVVLPELWTVGAFAYESFASGAEPLRGPTYEIMAKAASDAGVWLHAGSVPERGPAGDGEGGPGPGPGSGSGSGEGSPGSGEGTLYNTSLVFSPDGELAASYRKIHRFGFDKGEAVLMGAGSELVTVRLPEATVGMATCYDLRFPEMFRSLVDEGAEVLVVPAGWPERRRAHWTVLAQARAVENQSYVLACGTAGTHAGVPQAGHSIAVDPWGEVLGEAGAGEEILTVDLDPARVGSARERFPVLKDRVFDVGLPRR